jgi:hypothetical protein
MEFQPLSFNTQLMNLFLGMCKGVEGLPKHFRQLGYADKWIEFGFTNARNELVVPELVVASNNLRHTILFEWKEGANTDVDQLRRYDGITSPDLRQKVFLSEIESETHNTVIIGQSEYADRIVVAVDRHEFRFPVLVKSREGLTIIRNSFMPNETDEVFRPCLELDWEMVPTFLFPLDVDSTLSEYAELMVPAILERMGSGETRILLGKMAESIIPAWNIVDRAYQRRLSQKMLTVMERAVRHEFSQFLRRNRPAAGRTHTDTWDVIENPISNLADRSSQGWKQMLPLAKSLIDFFSPPAHQQDLPLDDDN